MKRIVIFALHEACCCLRNGSFGPEIWLWFIVVLLIYSHCCYKMFSPVVPLIHFEGTDMERHVVARRNAGLIALAETVQKVVVVNNGKRVEKRRWRTMNGSSATRFCFQNTCVASCDLGGLLSGWRRSPGAVVHALVVSRRHSGRSLATIFAWNGEVLLSKTIHSYIPVPNQ